MDRKSDEQLLIIQSAIETNMQESDEKIKKPTEELKATITSTIKYITDQINIPKSSPEQKN